MKVVKKVILTIIIAIILVAVIVGSILIYKGHEMYKKALAQISVKDKVEEIKSDENYVTISQLPQFYLDAVVAVEDRRFYDHGAIDPIGIARATWTNIKSFELREGRKYNYTTSCKKHIFYTRKISIKKNSRNIYGI